MPGYVSKLEQLNTTLLRFILTKHHSGQSSFVLPKTDKSPDIIIHYCSDIRVVIYSVLIKKISTAVGDLSPFDPLRQRIIFSVELDTDTQSFYTYLQAAHWHEAAIGCPRPLKMKQMIRPITGFHPHSYLLKNRQEH